MPRLPPAPVRALSGMERWSYEMDQGAPLNFTTAAKIGGPLTAEHVRAALPALQARHTALRWRIERAPNRRPWFQGGEAPPLALREVSAASHVGELEHEIGAAFDTARGPLARFALVECGAAGRWLLSTLHHAIADGISGVYLMRDLVQACAQAAQGRPVELAALEAVAPMEALLPPTARGLSAWRNHLRFFGREVALTLAHGAPFSVRPRGAVPGQARRARVLLRSIEPGEAARLAARARAENTTVHGALSAGMILALLADRGAKRGNVSFGSPANVRSLLSQAVGEHLGFYVSLVWFRAAVRADTAFWDLARAVRRQAEADLKSQSLLSMLSLVPPWGSLMGVGRLEPHKLVEVWDRRMPVTGGLTNLGRLPIEPNHGPFSIERCHIAAWPAALGNFVATATSLHGRVEWNFMWPEPELTHERATALADDAVGRVRRALEDSGRPGLLPFGTEHPAGGRRERELAEGAPVAEEGRSET